MEHAVAYASRTLSKAERNYSMTEKECLTISWAVGKFRPYLYGRPFKVVTERHAICWLLSLKDPSGRLGRWMLLLQEFDTTVTFKPGRRNAETDALSRCALSAPEDILLSHDDVIALSPFDAVLFATEQRKYPECFALIRHLDGTVIFYGRKFIRKSRHFVLLEGTLHRKNNYSNGAKSLLVVPAHILQEVFTLLHGYLTAGHSECFKTFQRFRRR